MLVLNNFYIFYYLNILNYLVNIDMISNMKVLKFSSVKVYDKRGWGIFYG